MKIKDVLLIILAVGIAFLLVDKACVSDDLQLEIEAHEKLKKSTAATHRAADQAKVKHEEEKKQLNEEIKDLARSVAARDLADAGEEEKLEVLEKEEPELEDPYEIIKNARAQNTVLRKQLATARFTINKLGKPIFSLSTTGEEIIEYPEGSVTDKLNKRFLAQVDLTVIETGKFNAERILRISADNVAEDAIKEAGRLRLGSKLKTYGLVIIGGIVIYSVVRK